MRCFLNLNKKVACIIAFLILLVLSLAHYVIFPGIELRFFLVSLLRKNREIKNPSSDKHCKAVSGASWSSEVTNYFVTTGCKIEDEVNFCCFCFVLYLSYSHGKAAVTVCFGCIQNLYHNKSVFVAQIGYSDKHKSVRNCASSDMVTLFWPKGHFSITWQLTDHFQ